MARRRWLLVVLMVIGLGMARILLFPVQSRGADQRVVPDNFWELEAAVGCRLYAPTWLPEGLDVAELEGSRGMHRVLVGYVDPMRHPALIVAQEPRSPGRDTHNESIFVQRADVRSNVNGKPAYLVTGQTGERRLFWNEEKVSIILSSTRLSDRELLEIARRMR